MKIIDLKANWYRGELISKTFLFEDDRSIDIDLNNEVCDMDGFMIAPESRIKAIEKKMNINIKR